MPPRDPRLCPAPEHSPPGDAVPGGPRRDGGAWDRWLVLFGDGAWHPVTVRAWRTDRLGREVVDVEWHAAGATWNDSYRVDQAKMCEP